MSAITWQDNRLMQRVGDDEAELGYIGTPTAAVAVATHKGPFVLWLRGPLHAPGSYLRGEEWPSLREARQEAARSLTAQLAHLAWMASKRKTCTTQPTLGLAPPVPAPSGKALSHSGNLSRDAGAVGVAAGNRR